MSATHRKTLIQEKRRLLTLLLMLYNIVTFESGANSLAKGRLSVRLLIDQCHFLLSIQDHAGDKELFIYVRALKSR
jgi:hypothetical protein